jgi:hypothetical protein
VASAGYGEANPLRAVKPVDVKDFPPTLLPTPVVKPALSPTPMGEWQDRSVHAAVAAQSVGMRDNPLYEEPGEEPGEDTGEDVGEDVGKDVKPAMVGEVPYGQVVAAAGMPPPQGGRYPLLAMHPKGTGFRSTQEYLKYSQVAHVDLYSMMGRLTKWPRPRPGSGRR